MSMGHLQTAPEQPWSVFLQSVDTKASALACDVHSSQCQLAFRVSHLCCHQMRGLACASMCSGAPYVLPSDTVLQLDASTSTFDHTVVTFSIEARGFVLDRPPK